MSKNCGCDGAHAPGQGKCKDSCLCRAQAKSGEKDPKSYPGIGGVPPKQKPAPNLVIIDGDCIIGLA